jgi:tRNA G26 N,N-dimethylase Trm1
MLNKIKEGSCVFYAPIGKISKKLPVFYNPDMKLNRDICVLLLKALPIELRIADILAGTGVRSIRLLKELPKERIKSIDINDNSPNAAKIIKKKQNKKQKNKCALQRRKFFPN